MNSYFYTISSYKNLMRLSHIHLCFVEDEISFDMEHFSTELDSLKRREPATKKLEEQEQEVRVGHEIAF